MGTEIPVPPSPVPPGPPGDPCTVCWGPGKAFPGEPTPATIVINVQGIQKAPSWVIADGEQPAGNFTLLQDEFLPCRYGLEIGDQTFELRFIVTTTRIILQSSNGGACFDSDFVDECELTFSNTLTAPFINGVVRILNVGN